MAWTLKQTSSSAPKEKLQKNKEVGHIVTPHKIDVINSRTQVRVFFPSLYIMFIVMQGHCNISIDFQGYLALLSWDRILVLRE